MTFTLAQASTADTSSAPALVFGMLVVIAAVSIVALTPRGRRSLLPAIAVMIGALITYTSIADAFIARFSVITVLGLFIGVMLILGGFGALREGIALPPVEGKDPEIEPRSPRVMPPDADSTEPGAGPSQVN